MTQTTMKEIDLLEMELKLMLENIERVRVFKQIREKDKYLQMSSRVLGELKHRGITLKSRITEVSKITTWDLLHNQHDTDNS